MTRSEEFLNRAEEYLEETKRSVYRSSKLDVRNTEKRIIEPLLADVLQWPLRMPEDDSEVDLSYDSGSRSVDYALVHDDQPLAFVMTQGYSEDIPESSGIADLFRDEGFSWGLLTNGKRHEFYTVVDGEVEQLETLRTDDLLNNYEFLTYMTVDSLVSGRTERERARYERVVRDREIIRSSAQRLASDLTDSVSSVDESVIRSETERLTENLEKELGSQDFFTTEDELSFDFNHNVGEKDGTTNTDNKQMNEQEDENSVESEPSESDLRFNPNSESEDISNSDDDSDDDDSGRRRLFSLFLGIF